MITNRNQHKFIQGSMFKAYRRLAPESNSKGLNQLFTSALNEAAFLGQAYSLQYYVHSLGFVACSIHNIPIVVYIEITDFDCFG